MALVQCNMAAALVEHVVADAGAFLKKAPLQVSFFLFIRSLVYFILKKKRHVSANCHIDPGLALGCVISSCW